MNTARALAVSRDLVDTVRTEQISFLAASIAYYMFVSVIPLLLLGLVVGSLVGGEAFAARVVGAVASALTPAAQGLLESALTSGVGRGGATVVGLAVLLWGALKMFRGLDLAFARIYGSVQSHSFVDQLRDALAALLGIGLALAGLGAVASLGALFGLQLAFGGLLLVPVLAVAFFPLYYVFPDEEMTVREAAPGALLAAVGWTVLGTAFGVYAAQADAFQLYGVVGGVLLLVTWFYFGGQILLVGAALNAVLAGVRDRQLQHEPLRESSKAMSEDADARAGDTPSPGGEPGLERSPDDLSEEELAALREEFESFREEVDDRTLHREDVEADLKQYVRRRMRRGHVRGWGPYVVLLYGTLMTLGAFYYLQGAWAVLAMLVVWLSTLGLYVVMVVVGVTFSAAGVPGRVADRVRDWRD
ncbi:YihY/virulence factor BrkB family protein [Halomicroarcula sp. GCM10025817]|uniref:YihY/virulence factor BrkB family protein n=1 Tax=Halomicroarcula sp. GCM10025817 TaxID=3252672 RepID=UPI00360E1815